MTVNSTGNTDRIAWVDVFKFLGIWAIYIGHFGEAGGKVYPFVFTYHVPMFFFAAGFFAMRAQKDDPITVLKKKTLQLMAPYAVFSLLALIFFAVQENWDILQTRDAALALASGIRGKIVAGSLWFLPCLYLIIIGDYFVMRLFKSQVIAFITSIGTFLITQTLLPHNPAIQPSWFLNLDSALYFYIYYSLGGLLFPLLKRDVTITSRRILLNAWTAFAFAVTVITYFQTPAWFFGKLTALIPALATFNLAFPILGVLIALTIIYCNIVAAKLLAHIPLLGNLGRETLIFCATEDVIKQIISLSLAMINLKVRLISPFMTIAFSLLCLIISYHTLVRFLNIYFPWTVGKTLPNRSA
jgi:fucose 4-O-acetylase-like acetyltransferase